MQFKCSNKSLLFNNKLFVIKSLEHLIQFILSYEGGEDDWGQGGISGLASGIGTGVPRELLRNKKNITQHIKHAKVHFDIRVTKILNVLPKFLFSLA